MHEENLEMLILSSTAHKGYLVVVFEKGAFNLPPGNFVYDAMWCCPSPEFATSRRNSEWPNTRMRQHAWVSYDKVVGLLPRSLRNKLAALQLLTAPGNVPGVGEADEWWESLVYYAYSHFTCAQIKAIKEAGSVEES